MKVRRTNLANVSNVSFVAFTIKAADFDLPTPRDADRAKAAIRALSQLRPGTVGDVAIRVQHGANETEAILPAAAFTLLLELLGHASRPHLVSLLESGALPHRRVGAHRPVMFRDIMEFKQRDALIRKPALDELAAEAQLLDLGY